MQEANVCMAVGSNDEVYPISRNDLEAAVGVFRGFHGWKTMTTRDEVHASLDMFQIHVEYIRVYHISIYFMFYVDIAAQAKSSVITHH